MRTGTAGTIVLSTSRSSRCRVGSEARESQGSFWSLPGPGPGGPGGPGVGVGQLGGGTSATAHSKDTRSAVRGARACKTFLPVRSPLWHSVSRRQRSTLGSRSPCVRTARSHLPRILNRERTDCPSAEARSRRSPLCSGREPIRLHVRRPRLPRGINRVEQEAEKWM